MAEQLRGETVAATKVSWPDAVEIRRECLALAIAHAGHTSERDAVMLAERFFAFVTGENKAP